MRYTFRCMADAVACSLVNAYFDVMARLLQQLRLAAQAARHSINNPAPECTVVSRQPAAFGPVPVGRASVLLPFRIGSGDVRRARFAAQPHQLSWFCDPFTP